MTERYNVYFAGRLMDGHDLDSVREKLARVFNVDQQTLDKLFSGKNQLVKSDCDKATALKYKVAMQYIVQLHGISKQPQAVIFLQLPTWRY